MKHWRTFAVGFLGLCVAASSGFAAEETALATSRGLDTVWVLVAAFLVFFMQAGFGMVEAGFIRAKNACNILTKNFLDYCVASVMFFLVGYALMFGEGSGFAGWTGFGLAGAENPSGVDLYAFWLFQAAFCGAAATIVAGGMAERMKFPAYLMYTAVISAVVYPIIGHWIWSGQGWLAGMGFADFAGSTVVHATGGWVAFIGTIVLGPRVGKFSADGKANAIPGHSIPLAALGVFLLWFGWFGFNPGSTLGVGDGEAIGRVAMNTNLAAATGAISAMLTVWLVFGKPDLSMTMNGALAGLVAITAPCAFVSGAAALAIGVVAGAIVVLGVALLDRIGVDDPVGAVPVHGMNGIWGTLAVGIWGREALGLARNGLLHGGGLTQLGIQALGAVTVSLFALATMGIVFYLIDRTVGLRVSREEEMRGLDIGEHGMEAYAGFQIFTTQ
ncbi:MAG: ammonium transporter [Candidatus Brocadiaceae bacterium]|jgi:Amt family ammonium transporter